MISRIHQIRFIGLAVACAISLGSCRQAEQKKTRLLARAEGYFKAGDYEKAKIEYLNVIRLDFRNPKAVEQLGKIWLEEGVPLRAYPYLLNARDHEPENLEIRTELASILASLGELEDARKEALAVLQQTPGSEGALLVLADTAQTLEEIEQVKEELRKVPFGSEAAYHLALAKLAIRTNELAYAKSELQEAVKAEPSSLHAHLALASFYSSQGNWAAAEREFKNAVELDRSTPKARVEYARFEMENGATDNAKTLLEETVKAAPNYLPGRCLLAQIAFEQGKFDEAMTLLERVLYTDFANIDARILQAQVWLGKGETKQATEVMEGLDAIYPNVPLIKYQLARAYLRRNDAAKAIIALDQAIAAKPDYAESILLLGEIDLRRGDAAAVVPAMLGLLEKRPGLVAAQLLLAESYRAMGRLDEAAETIQAQIRAAPGSAEAHFRLGLILREQHRVNQARKAFESAMELAPDDPAALDQLVELDISANNFTAALERAQRKLAETPNSAVTYFAEAKIFAAQKDWNRAQDALLKTIELDPSLSGAYELLVSSYFAADKVPQAVNQLRRVLADSPNNQAALMTLALIYDKTKNFSSARDAYEELLSVNPTLADALNNLAYLYAERFNDPKKAYELARKARILQPNSPAVADTLGWVLYKREQYQEALNLVQESAAAFPSNPDVQFHLGMVSYMMDQQDAARQAFKRAVGAPADSPSKQEASKWLAYLEDDSGSAKQFSVPELEALANQRPNDPIARMRLAALYEKQGAAREAAAQYEAALNLNPNLGNAKLKLAQLWAGPLHDSNKALELAKEARQLTGDDPRTAGTLGSIAYKAGSFSWAYSLLHQAARQSPNDLVVAHDLAWSAYSLGKVSEAREVMRRVAEASPVPELAKDATLFLQMTAPDLETSASTEAKLQEMLAKDHDYVPALFAKAILEKRRGGSKSAIETCNQILQHFPEFAPAQKQLALLYLEDPRHVVDAYELALKARSTLLDDGELAQVLGETSYKKQQFENAIEWFQQSERKQQLTGKDLYYLGMSQVRTTQVAEGRKTLERALRSGLQEPMLQETKDALTDGQKRDGQ